MLARTTHFVLCRFQVPFLSIYRQLPVGSAATRWFCRSVASSQRPRPQLLRRLPFHFPMEVPYWRLSIDSTVPWPPPKAPGHSPSLRRLPFHFPMEVPCWRFPIGCNCSMASSCRPGSAGSKYRAGSATIGKSVFRNQFCRSGLPVRRGGRTGGYRLGSAVP